MTTAETIAKPMTIAHATALTAEDRPVFEHALALARAANGRLFSVNARTGSDENRTIPDAARLLADWGCTADHVPHEAMIHTCCDDPIDTLLDALRRVAPDLIVAGTHQRSTASRMIFGSSNVSYFNRLHKISITDLSR